MKNIIVAVLVLFGLFSQVAMADGNTLNDSAFPSAVSEHGASPWYIAGGAVELVSSGGMKVSKQEEGFLANQQFWKSSRTESLRRVAKEVAIGYEMNDKLAFEFGYIRGDRGASSETTATMPATDQLGNPISVPMSITQKEALSAWHLSFVGQKPLNDYVTAMARIGMMRVHTEWEQRQKYSWPASMGGDGSSQIWSHSSDKESVLYGLGFTARVANNTDARMEVMKSPSLPNAVASASLVFHL